MNKLALIVMILKTGLCTLFFVGGIYLLTLSKERWERFVGSLISVREMEMSTGSLVFIKTVGVILLVLSLFCIYRFFVYDPDAQYEQGSIEPAQNSVYLLPVGFAMPREG